MFRIFIIIFIITTYYMKLALLENKVVLVISPPPSQAVLFNLQDILSLELCRLRSFIGHVF